MTTTDKIPGPDGEPPKKAYGERTMGLMIQRALAQAGLKRKPAKTTGYYVALVEDRLKANARRTWIVVAITSLLTAVGAVAAVFIAATSSPAPVYQTTAVNYGEPIGTGIAAANRFNVFLLAGDRGQGLEGFCTAFALASNLLVTNAHCIAEGTSKYRGFFAFMNGVAGQRYIVTRTVTHPEYDAGNLSADVGLLEISGQLTSACAVAPTSVLQGIGPGATVFVYGFPARLSNPAAPEATLTRGEVGRVTTLGLVPGAADANVLIQHSAFISGGTSGSPIFDGQGYVVGVNAGGYADNGATLTGYNYGMRIDLALPLLRSFAAR
jgi:S1-C subfamily serine protease